MKTIVRFVRALWSRLTVWLLLFVVVSFVTAFPAHAHPGHGGHFLTESILSPQLTIAGLILAFIFGAVHALTPGHGKTIVTAYLIGSNSTYWHALLLSIVTTITHTFGVFLLGFIALFASNYLLPEQLYVVLSLLSGIAICSIGFWQLESYFNPVEEHYHYHAEDPLTTRSLTTLGIGNGLIPCSEALILLLGAIAIGRSLYGIWLVLAFSLGLALSLSSISLTAIYCRQWLERLPQFNFMQQYLPLFSAIAISIIGLILTTQAIV